MIFFCTARVAQNFNDSGGHIRVDATSIRTRALRVAQSQ